MSSTLEIRLFGELSITYDNRPVVGISTARSQALLAYLVLHRHSPQPRQRLAFHLWSNSTDTQARTNLRKELSHLRRDLPQADQFLLVESKTLQWSPMASFELDVMEFENALKTAETADSNTVQAVLKQAITLYKGDLLPSCEDEWIVLERERLQQMYVSALEQLIDQLHEQQDYRSALNYAQQLLRVNSLNEATYCILMRLYQQNGDRANALQIYHRCMTLLREELGVDPSSTTRKLYEQLLLEDQSPVAAPIQPPTRLRLAPPSPSPLPLVGRQPEWKLIQAWANSATSDAPSSVLLVTGEPGIGKTRLLEELRATVPIALWGRGFAAETVRPYGIWIDAFRSVVLPTAIPTELGFLLPEVGQPSAVPPDRGHLFDAVVQLLSTWSNQAPLVIILDDIQWIDEASSALLHYAIRLLSHSPVRFACTARSAELEENSAISQVVQALRRERRLQILELQPFDRGGMAELIRNIHPEEAPDLSLEVVDQVFIDSGGNPLFALEVAHALLQHSATGHAETLEALIGDRLQKLDVRARDVLPWAAALGRSFKPTMVAQVADFPLPQLLGAIEQLERQAVIRPSTSTANEIGYDFAHDIVRQVVYRQLSEPRRHLVHLQIAHKLNQLSMPDHALASDIAHHASLGGDHELAASTALLAAERCLKLFAYTEASTVAQRGLQHCRYLDERTRIRLQLGLLRVMALAGVTGERAAQLEAEVSQLMDEARRLGLKDEEAIGLEAVGIVYFNQNNFTNVHQHSLRAIEVSQAASPATAARLLAYSGSCLAELGHEVVRAEALLLEAQSLAARVGLELCDIYSGLGAVYLHYGRYAEARSLLKQAWQMTQLEQDHWREFSYLSYLAMLELEVANPDAALSCCEEMEVVAAQIQGEGSEGAIASALKALANYNLQQPAAESVLEEAILKLRHVDAKRMLSYVLIGAAEVDLAQGRAELAAIRSKTALQTAQVMQYPSEIALAWAISLQANLALGKQEPSITCSVSLPDEIERHTLCFRAQKALEQTITQIQNATIK